MRVGLQRCLFAGLLAMAGCVINPVPTPGPNATGSGGGWAGPGDAGSSVDGAPSFADVTPTVANFTASDADPQAKVHAGAQLAAWAVGPTPSGRLVVLLPTSGEDVGAYASLVQVAAAYGHRVLVLDGPWTQELGALCGGNVGCQESVRLEWLDGQDHAAQVDVATADGLEVRLVRALQWLAVHASTGGWQPFLASNQPVWSSLVVIGHGTGGGEAMMLAAKHPVARVGLLGAPDDGDAKGAAPWLAQHATPSTQIRGFAHLGAPNFTAITQAWTALGLGGKLDRVDVDTQPPPYDAWRQLTTDADCSAPASCIAFDVRYRNVWRTLVGKP